jgi:hypothetical protein
MWDLPDSEYPVHSGCCVAANGIYRVREFLSALIGSRSNGIDVRLHIIE